MGISTVGVEPYTEITSPVESKIEPETEEHSSKPSTDGSPPGGDPPDDGSPSDEPPKKTSNNSSNDEKIRKEKIRKLIDNVAVRLEAGIENGLFEQKGLRELSEDEKKLNMVLPKWQDIHMKIAEARELLDKNLNKSESKQEEALNSYFVAVNRAGLSWRFSELYAGYTWIFLIGTLIAIFAFYYFGLEKELVDTLKTKNLEISYVAIDVTAWGVIGSTLRGLWWLRFNVASNKYRKGWRLHYASSPFIGGILGALVYILIFGGLVSVTNTPITPTNSVAIIPIAAFAGFNWDWAVKLFNRIEKIIEVKDSEKDDDKS
jgi:hypothetical protein